jgi:hypothetical protein
MIIKKVTAGFVIQTFDTETRKYVNQEFIAGDVSYENAVGDSVDPELMQNITDGTEPYLPFDMVQPS